ncbi:TetR/AcrR family transcriptional regulator [Sphaerisporangium rhizosphaerae]|uniref:TetR/AcrR family transcriptional regulator n=1 Tax=Sphaerisporangium rhizosphaerae TaxID=2269375 RepID=A0ABW2PHM1_9ACTN
MPRISAPTVAQHRAAQRRALLDAARAILAEGAGTAPGPADVTARAGLARSSFYQYFRSRQDLLDALVQDLFPRWSQRVVGEMAEASGPGERVLAYVDANLRLVAEGEHTIARALAAVAPGEGLDAGSKDMHQRLLHPLIDALGEMGASDPAAIAEMINAVVYAASRMIESGSAEQAVRSRARELLAPYLLNGRPDGGAAR